MKVMGATRRGVPKLDGLTKKVKTVLMQHDSAYVPDKQIHRWEGEGGAQCPAQAAAET